VDGVPMPPRSIQLVIQFSTDDNINHDDLQKAIAYGIREIFHHSNIKPKEITYSLKQEVELG